MDKHWITQATSWLKACREPVPHEINFMIVILNAATHGIGSNFRGNDT